MKRRNMNPALAMVSKRIEENKIIAAASKANMIISLMVLCDKFDFTTEQVETYMTEFRKQLDAYNEGYVENVKDFQEVLKEEYGIEI